MSDDFQPKCPNCGHYAFGWCFYHPVVPVRTNPTVCCPAHTWIAEGDN